MQILVITSHPDDEVLGCGGTIARHVSDGDDVHLCIVTKACPLEWPEDEIKERKEEALKVGQILGIKKTYFLDLPTVNLDTMPQKELNEKITQVINETQPEILYIPHGENVIRDHRLVFEAALVATTPRSAPAIKKVLCYEVLPETEWTAPSVENAFIPNVYVDISEVLETKLKAMVEYKSELKQKFKVNRIGIFGSYIREEQTKLSDVDLLVELIEPIGWEFVDLKEFLEGILGVNVDLLTINALKPQ